MKDDRIFKIMTIMAGIFGLIAMSVGQFILAFVGFAVCAAFFILRGKGDFNDRNIYNKMVESENGTLDGLYEYLNNTTTFLGKCWRGGYEGLSDDCIVFGPDAHKDCIVIARNDSKKRFELMSVTAVSKIRRKPEDEWRFEIIQDTSDLEVTVKRFSIFSAFQVMNVVLLDNLVDEVRKYTEGCESAPAELQKSFKLYHYNTKENIMFDIEDNEMMTAERSMQPLEIILRDTDGEELVSLKGLSDDPKKPDKKGFDIFTGGELYGHVEHITNMGHDCFRVNCDAGEFEFKSFLAIMRARISSNYNVFHNGQYVASIANSTKITFDSIGQTKLHIVMCEDDEYLVLYMLINILITLLHDFLR